MSLENLERIEQIKPHPPDRDEIQKLLRASQRDLADAQIEDISAENRYDMAYKALMKAALAALMANGYRPNSNKPGHHMTVIQCLPHTIGLDKKLVMVLDALRRKRNVADYSGEDIDEGSARECFEQATSLRTAVHDWIRETRPELAE